ncbi:MAG: methyltransferase domain-containing protein [Gaiellaceae bacterium MAG52_C11]|nr:methyltransferase domain-containing protein [Candidatus Gaiellasilicea maunaloa]
MSGERGVVADYWEEHAGRYDDDFGDPGSDGHALRARLAATLRLLGAGPGDLLDAGMGPGRLCEALDQQGWTVSGVDVSGSMVELAQRRVPSAAARLVVGEIERLPFDDELFDAVVATGVLEYADVTRALGELNRVARPGGLVVVSYPNPHALYGIWKTQVFYRSVRVLKRLGRRPHHWMPRGGPTVSPNRFAGLLRSAGLVVESVEHTSYLVVPTPLDAMLPRVTARLGARLEGSSRPARLLATQVVYAARKPS